MCGGHSCCLSYRNLEQDYQADPGRQACRWQPQPQQDLDEQDACATWWPGGEPLRPTGLPDADLPTRRWTIPPLKKYAISAACQRPHHPSYPRTRPAIPAETPVRWSSSGPKPRGARLQDSPALLQTSMQNPSAIRATGQQPRDTQASAVDTPALSHRPPHWQDTLEQIAQG